MVTLRHPVAFPAAVYTSFAASLREGFNISAITINETVYWNYVYFDFFTKYTIL